MVLWRYPPAKTPLVALHPPPLGTPDCKASPKSVELPSVLIVKNSNTDTGPTGLFPLAKIPLVELFTEELTIFARPGKDGADKVLMEKAVDKLDDFDRIVVASGDHFFTDLCNKVLKLSKKLVIISTQHGFSNSLKRIPCEKITFEMKKNDLKTIFFTVTYFGIMSSINYLFIKHQYFLLIH